MQNFMRSNEAGLGKYPVFLFREGQGDWVGPVRSARGTVQTVDSGDWPSTGK